MFTISNDKDLRLAYSLIRISNVPDSFIVSLKKEIRRINAIKQENNNIPTYLSESLDHYIEKIKLPEKIKDKESASNYFIKYYYLHYTPTYYDCTGQRFTNWYKIYKMNNRWVAYHSVSVDI